MLNKSSIKKYKSGLTLIEAVIYFSMLAVLVTVVMSSLISLFKSYSFVKSEQDIETTAIQVFDKLTRDVQNANSIVSASSSFGVAEGSIGITIASTSGATTDNFSYYSQNGALKVSQNGIYIGNLSLPSVTVNSFVVRYINGTSTQAMKIELNLQATPRFGTSTINENFYTTIQLRD